MKILLFNKGDEANPGCFELMHQLHISGHHPEFASRTLRSLGMDVRRVARFVESTPADAWVVIVASR